jgi:hypothetical protein
MRERFVRTACVLSIALASASVLQAQTSQPGGQANAQSAQTPASAPKLTFAGDVALWTVAIRPDKTADFERVIARLHEALTGSANADRQKQAAGWKVMKLEKPLPDGNIAYVHVISPVVRGADYSIMEILYDAFPNERQQLYELYRGAFAQNLSLAAGQVVTDMSKPAQTAASNIGQ